MAESVLFDIAVRIIESLGSLALKQIGLLCCVKDELDKLKDTVSRFKAVLLDAEEKQAVNHEVRYWLEKLMDAVYDAEDLLDDFSTECLLREMMNRDNVAKKVRIFFSKANQLVYDLKLGHKIKAIRQTLDALEKDRTRFHLEERLVERGVTARKRRDTHSFVLEADVIGRENAKKEIIDIIISDSNVKENVAILPIFGIGGLGKTTLAQLIFNDEKVDKHFELKMWVCVSDNFDVSEVVEKVLESATNWKPDRVEMNTLVNGLRKEIGEKKYLLVLDDVWTQEVAKWDELKKILMCGVSGSRILVTTRSEMVARITKTIEPYSLEALDSQKSWSLFKKVAFEKGLEPENSQIVTIGKEIVEKCSGVPLAIKTIGRLLSFENSEAGWVSFKNNKLPKIKDNDIIPTLKLSYDQLPSHLKQCFAYCSIFPKDYVINKSKLIDLWIAQGFIKRSNLNERLEDAGHEYYMDLLWRSFFQEAKIDDLGNVTRCKMHDLMHDLAISVAGSLITRLESEGEMVGQKTLHISFVHDIDFSSVVSSFSPEANRIRTLLCVNQTNTSCETIFSSLKFLRVLDLHGGKFDLVPSSICKLKLLRYIDLSRNKHIQKLPNSIRMLQNLYTIRLSSCYNLIELPRAITKLVNLRHLYNDDCDSLTCMPRGLGQLTNLQTLSTFVVDNSKDSGLLSELNRLNNLRGALEITGLRFGEDYKGANLKEKEHLQFLEGFEPPPNLKSLSINNCGDVRFWMGLLSFTNLVSLSFYNCMKLKYLPPLSRLRSLKTVSLELLEEIEYVSDCGDDNEFSSSSSSSSAFFPSLEVILIADCPNLKGWWRRTGHALLLPSFPPPLSELRVSNCPMLTSLPMFPHLNKELCLDSASWKPVQQTMMNNAKLSTTMEASSAPLSKLKYLELSVIEDIETLPEDGLQSLISLQRLIIESCPRLKSLSQGVLYLTELQKLSLCRCPKLDLGNDEHGMQWKGLKSLVSLQFERIPKLVSLPLGLQHVTTLRELSILDCSSLMAIPEWICNWASLERFTIYRCSGLTSLPDAMSRLTTLKSLIISHCPILLGRCEKDRGEDWTKIAHIPNIQSMGAEEEQMEEIWEEIPEEIPEEIGDCEFVIPRQQFQHGIHFYQAWENKG